MYYKIDNLINLTEFVQKMLNIFSLGKMFEEFLLA